MDALYKIIKQLPDNEFEALYDNLASNRAEKSAHFLEIIRKGTNPAEEFLEKNELSTSAFYVLKSRLNRKIENFLLSRLGAPEMEATQKALHAYQLIFEQPEEIALGTLRELERLMVEQDNPHALMHIYSALRMLNHENYQDRINYGKLYNQAVARYLAGEKAVEAIQQFFRSSNKYHLTKRDRDLPDIKKSLERLYTLNTLYKSERLYIFLATAQLYAQLFLPEEVLEGLSPEKIEKTFQRVFMILKANEKDLYFKHLNLLFDYLRFAYYYRESQWNQAEIYFGLLDNKIEQLLSGFHLGMDASRFLFYKLNWQHRSGELQRMTEELESGYFQGELSEVKLGATINVAIFKAQLALLKGDFTTTARELYILRNVVSLRKYPFVNLEVKCLQCLAYLLQGEESLGRQLVLSLQRQVKKVDYKDYPQAEILIKIFTQSLSSRSGRVEDILEMAEKFSTLNKGKYELFSSVTIEPFLAKLVN